MMIDSSTDLSKETLDDIFSAWANLNESDKHTVLHDLRFAELPVPLPPDPAEEEPSIAEATSIQSGVSLGLRYLYLYFYPYLNWNLDRTPDTNDYWVGIYQKGAKNTEYKAYQWIRKTTEGQYYAGKILDSGATTGMQVEYELRVFNGGYRKKAATTNIMTGRAFSTWSTSPVSEGAVTEVEEPEESPSLAALENFNKSDVPEFQGRDAFNSVQELWNQLNGSDQELIYPLLREDLLPSSLTSPESVDPGPEPKELYQDLDADLDEPELAEESKAPSKIVVSISLYDGITYVYPVCKVTSDTGGKSGWMGVYKAQRNKSFDPDKKLTYSWCGTNYKGKTYNMKRQRDQTRGHMENEYIGACFKWVSTGWFGKGHYEQIGLAGKTVTVGIEVSPVEPLPTKAIEFNVDSTLRLAKLSQLAYSSYQNVKTKLPTFDLVAEMEISNSGSGTAGYIASGANEVVVAFRGTEWNSATDWMTDFWFNLAEVKAGSTTAYAHAGFASALNSVYDGINQKLKSILGQKDLIITGHSLGAGLASIAAFKLAPEYVANQRVLTTFGCPPCGDIDFVKSFEATNTSTIIMPGDIVGDIEGENLLPKLGPWVNLYQPKTVYYLPRNMGLTGHLISTYIAQLEALP